MSELKITTNYHWREPVTFFDMPKKEQEWFDYVTGEDRYGPHFFCYRDAWYDLSQFMRTNGDMFGNLAGWHRYQSDSFFSGVVVRCSKDGETIQIGRYTC